MLKILDKKVSEDMMILKEKFKSLQIATKEMCS